MRSVVQRVKFALVEIENKRISEIGKGLLVLIGISHEDDGEQIEWMAKKLVNLRIFEDEKGKMNLSVLEVKGEILLISQFTLLGNCMKGRRPDFLDAAKPQKAEKFYLELAAALQRNGIKPKLGEFGKHMSITLLNDGPVTMILEK
ncbi:MAG: D-tyrosyl-tRNA(Tyr) deacylase [Candidatus Cloacimonetes bacterium]|nr:D-tyrosyl-tRNA(Tyr) deacylase [Candidatus Cloacimonadota bacterium]